MSRRSRVAVTGVASALIASGVIALPLSTATAVSDDVVISEVYGGGGNSGATYTHDFVELRNTGTSTVDLNGWSVQYASSAGTSWQATGLTGRIEPGERYLVQQAQGAGGSTPLPRPDAVGTIPMAGASGKVALVTSSSNLACGADCDQAASVKDFVGYGSANDYETAPTRTLSNSTSASRTGDDTDNNLADFTVGAPNPESTGRGVQDPPPPPGVEGLEIHDIQGAGHLSEYDDERVIDVPGVVTVTKDDGSFWMQSETPDDDVATSEGIFVYRPKTRPAVGDRVTVSGEVTEFRPGGSGGWDNLTLTEISGSPTVNVVGQGELPEPTMIGEDRVPPGKVIDNDSSSSVEWSGSFDAEEDGIDFWESMEGMVLGIEDAYATGPRNNFGELPVVAPGTAGPFTARGGLYVAPDDFNPERVMLDDDLASTPMAHTGDTLPGTTVGVLDYSFANFKLLPWEAPELSSGGLTRESTRRALGSELAIASYNVENLDAGDPQEKFDALALQIVENLESPDVIGLEEVQDDSGPANDGTTTPERTLQMLTDAITRAGGPTYDWRQIDPVDGEEGGQPGGNIRVAFLFNTDRGVEFVDRGNPDSSTAATVFTDEKGVAHLETSPARVAPESDAWDDSRVPLVGEFTWKGRTFFAVANHFSSKGGDDPLFGRWQPPTRFTEEDRHKQAAEVRGFVDTVLGADSDARIAVVGDINDFEFSETVDILVGHGDTKLTDLPRTLPEEEQYTYVYQGNSQVLDHILLSPQFVADTFDYDIVHVNAEFADQISDHDPQVVRIANPNRTRP